MLFTFESEETGKNYVVYTDNTEDEDGNTNVYASIYEPDVGKTKLIPVETEEEWAMIQNLLEEVQNEVDAEDDE